MSTILKFVRQLNSILSTTVEAPSIALRLFLLAAQIADECGFENLTYDMYVDAFSVFEESISESRAQLQAITLIIGTLQGARVFSEDNYDTLITKAALHGAKLLKKPHQASAVNLASHLWWQDVPAEEEQAEAPSPAPKEATEKSASKEEGESPKSVCVNNFLREAFFLRVGAVSSPGQQARVGMPPEGASDRELCDGGDHHHPAVLRHARPVLFLPRPRRPSGKHTSFPSRIEHSVLTPAPQINAKFVNSLVELITASIDSIASPDVHPSQRAPPGLLEGVQTPEMITRHFRNTLVYIQGKKAAAAAAADAGGAAESRWDDVDIVGATIKMGIPAR